MLVNYSERNVADSVCFLGGEELPLLAPLPATPFELAEWKQATVQFNYRIAVVIIIGAIIEEPF